ncbi:hypothetical protein FUAX_17400 [Fulvitalea axinellae]|uniref:Amidoligase enzyme n=1 Tax=Fulvitalea axinellae TaxID=1182444 RepID=A0AAU9D024_9BACT|nr:hypothetical protein FUAX_17400 [Fulvitalea axinellae]
MFVRQISKRKNTTEESKSSSRTPPVIQRKVGFEVEVECEVFRNPEQAREFDASKEPVFRPAFTKPIRKYDVLLKGQGFELQTDLGFPSRVPYLEFVTDPFEETDAGQAQMDRTFGEIVRIMRTLSESVSSAGFSLETCLRPFGEIPDEMRKVIIRSEHVEQGNFQFTAGIRLGALPKIFDDLGTPRAEAPALSKKRDPGRKYLIDWERDLDFKTGLKHEADDFGKIIRIVNDMAQRYGHSEKLQGLLCLIGQYLALGNDPCASYPKTMFPITPRTSFARIFELIPPEEKEKYADESEWVALVYELFGALRIGPVRAPLFTQGIHLEDELFKERRHNLNRITRALWLRNIPKGKDLLNKEDCPFPEAKPELYFANLGPKTDEDPKTKEQTPILEFRRLCQELPYRKWPEFAREIFVWVRGVNEARDLFFNENNGLP